MSLCISATMIAGPIDLEKAKSLAASFMPVSTDPVLVKTAVRNEAKSRTLDEKTKSAAPYYIFSRGENQGFVIVSGDDCLPEILGYTESGNFDEELLPPHLLGWLDHYANLIEEAQANGVNTPNEARTRSSIEPNVRTADARVNIDPLVTAHWHQSGPYNNRCPYLTGTTNRAVTGCVATAAAQVIYYWRKDNPATLLATTPTYGYGDAPVTVSYPKGTPMKWELMLDNYNGSRPAEYDDAVATFNAAVGAGTWLTYGSSTSGQISDLVNTFNSYFRMSSTCLYKDGQSQTAWENLIYTELIAGRPIVYNSRTNIGPFDEIIEPGALDQADLTDVRFLVNHDTSKIPLARSRRNNGNSTMQFSVDVFGLNLDWVKLDTENNSEARALKSAVKRGDISGMSFMFSVDDEEWSEIESDHPTRHIKKIGSVVEVSAVTFPAYESTEIYARSKEALDNARSALESVRRQNSGSVDTDQLELLKAKISLM